MSRRYVDKRKVFSVLNDGWKYVKYPDGEKVTHNDRFLMEKEEPQPEPVKVKKGKK